MIGCLFWRYRVFDFFFMKWIEQYGKLTSFFYASVLFPLINCVINFDNVTTKFNIFKKTPRPRKWRHFRESKINLASRENITQAKFKQFMNFIFYKWGNYYFISKVIVVSSIGKDAWDSVSAITRVKPLRSFTLKLYSMLCRRRGASAKKRLKILSKGLWLVCTVMSPLPKAVDRTP